MNKLILLLVLLLAIFSCTKQEEVPKKDLNPLKIEISQSQNIIANKKEIILAADILYLPEEETIVEHGFVLFKTEPFFGSSGEFETYVIKEKPVPGNITYKLSDVKFAEFGRTYQYHYYITTNNKTYTTQTKSFELSKFIINSFNVVKAAYNEEINITGDFSELNSDYALLDAKGTIIPYKINTKNNISFKLPNAYSHGDIIAFSLKNSKDSSEPQHTLVNVQVLGKIKEPENFTYKYMDDLILSGTNLGRELKIIVGSREIGYYSKITIQELLYDQKGNAFEFGYDNGRERVLFSQKLKLKDIPSDIFVFKEHTVHPNTDTPIESDIFDYMSTMTLTVGNVQCAIRSNIENDLFLMLGNVPDGKHPIKITNNNYNFQSSATINVESLKFQSMDSDEGSPHDKIGIKANFLETKSLDYYIDFGGFVSKIFITKPGEGYFTVPEIRDGNYPVIIGYGSYDYYIMNTKISTGKFFNIKASETNLDFFPKKATAGQRVKLVMTGFSSSILFIGNQSVMVSHEADGVYFYIPENLPKGKYKISMLAARDALKYYEPNDYLEIY